MTRRDLKEIVYTLFQMWFFLFVIVFIGTALAILWAVGAFLITL